MALPALTDGIVVGPASELAGTIQALVGGLVLVWFFITRLSSLPGFSGLLCSHLRFPVVYSIYI